MTLEMINYWGADMGLNDIVTSNMLIALGIVLAVRILFSAIHFMPSGRLWAEGYMASLHEFDDSFSAVFHIRVHNEMDKPLYLKRVTVKYLTSANTHTMMLIYRYDGGWERYVKADIMVDGLSSQTDFVEFAQNSNGKIRLDPIKHKTLLSI